MYRAPYGGRELWIPVLFLFLLHLLMCMHEKPLYFTNVTCLEVSQI